MNNTFKEDIHRGFSQKPKQISSKYFYNDKGSKLFQDIMRLPEYYLTNKEDEILRNQSLKIYEALGFTSEFNIIELGAGDGTKTVHFLRCLIDNNISFTYRPIDISEKAIELLKYHLQKELPTLRIDPLIGDYHKLLQEPIDRNKPSLLLFLGSNLGNYNHDDSINLLSLFNHSLNKNDKLLIGLDRQKNPHTIYNAYADSQGVTKEFNLNLLTRVNQELGGTFTKDNFDFFCSYNPENGELKSWIVSLIEQTVYVEKLNQSYHFEKNELIWTEVSKKYSDGELDILSQQSGFSIVHNFKDDEEFFVDSLWVKP